MTASLPAPPAALVEQGQARHGRYAGLMSRLDWSGLQTADRHGWLWRRLHHKRWQYVGMGSPDLFVGIAIVSLGWCQTAFAYVFDRQRREVVVDWSADGLPALNGRVSDEPVIGAHAWFRKMGSSLSIAHQADGHLHVAVQVRGLQLQASLALQDAPPFLLAVGPIANGASHATQKSPGLAVSGWLEAAGQRHSLDHAVACLDSSNGLLARDTSWRWACAHGRDMGFNLQAGYFGHAENALWLDGQLIPLGPAVFEFDPGQPLKPWRVHTTDGLLDLVFTPEGARQANRNLGIAASHYVQPVGTFRGVVRAAAHAPARPVEGLLGVTEDHRSRW
ncbi:MAG: DUF2804 domain-containing protein [Acidobacteriota bacterium]